MSLQHAKVVRELPRDPFTASDWEKISPRLTAKPHLCVEKLNYIGRQPEILGSIPSQFFNCSSVYIYKHLTETKFLERVKVTKFINKQCFLKQALSRVFTSSV